MNGVSETRIDQWKTKLLTFVLLVGLQVGEDDLAQLPGALLAWATVVVPDAQESERAQTLLHTQHVVVDAATRVLLE